MLVIVKLCVSFLCERLTAELVDVRFLLPSFLSLPVSYRAIQLLLGNKPNQGNVPASVFRCLLRICCTSTHRCLYSRRQYTIHSVAVCNECTSVSSPSTSLQTLHVFMELISNQGCIFCIIMTNLQRFGYSMCCSFPFPLKQS